MYNKMNFSCYRSFACIYLLFFSVISFAGEDCQTTLNSMDNKIVEAFNASPKQTAQVYLYALDILKNTGRSSCEDANAWNLKARKLITLACYNEACIAITDGNFEQALVWCQRGLSKGAKRGSMTDYNIGWFYDNLGSLKEIIENKLYGKEGALKYQQTGMLRNEGNWRANKRKSPYEKVVKSDYELISGPKQDAFRNTYVLIRTKNNKKQKIKYYPDKGWGIALFGNEPDVFYMTWQECAESINN